MNWVTVGIAIGKTVGQVLISLAMSMLTGRAFKRLILWPFEALSKKTRTKKDDQIVQDAKRDLGVDQ
jgi:hypothetical protein